MIYDGECALSSGFFLSGTTGFYANSAGHYCSFASYPQYVATGGPPDTANVPNYPVIPRSMAYDGPCPLPEGIFLSGTTGFYSNGAAQYCSFDSYDQYLRHGGPPDTSEVPNYPVIPSSMTYVGSCGG
jgi:hypothetical protein